MLDTLPQRQMDLDFSLVKSSPLKGTDLKQAKTLLNSMIQTSCDLPSLAKQYTERISRAFESTGGGNVIQSNLQEVEKLRSTRNIRKQAI